MDYLMERQTKQKIRSRIDEAARYAGVLPEKIDKAIEVALPVFYVGSTGGVVTREYQSPELIYRAGLSR